MQVNMHEAKTKLSALGEKAWQDETTKKIASSKLSGNFVTGKNL